MGDINLVDTVTVSMLNTIWSKYRENSLLFAGDCLEKAAIAREHLPFQTQVAIGGLALQDPLTRSDFIFDYDPPLMFHAWLESEEGKIIDFSFPGVVFRAIELWRDIDESKGRENPGISAITPMLLIGSVPIWAKYSRHKIFYEVKSEGKP
jgi:hypothetical protein